MNFADVLNGSPLIKSADTNWNSIPFAGDAVRCGKIPEVAEELGSLTSFINAGSQATTGEYPWVALVELGVVGSNGNELFCGGVLITKYHVLCAAHCMVPHRRIGDRNLYTGNIEDVKIRMGAPERSAEIDQDLTFGVERITMHPQSSLVGTPKYDIAIIKLRTPVPYSSSIYPICLPKSQENFRGSNATVVGWGKDGYSNTGKT